MKKNKLISGLLLIAILGMIFFSHVQASTYNVITPTADVSVPGSLPWCVNASNNITPSQPDIINFVLDPASNSITVHTPLVLTDTVEIIGNQMKVGAHDGSGSSPQTLFLLQAGSGGTTITGLSIIDSQNGIYIHNGSDSNFIYGNRIGTDWADTSGLGNSYGLYVLSDYNTIGGTTAGTGNIVSDNTQVGILLNSGATQNNIFGNYIGTNSTGAAALGNQSAGIYINFSPQNLVGGDRSLGEGNVISGNNNYGVVLEGVASFGNTICGNSIGLDVNELTAIQNNNGIAFAQSSGNFIGLPITNHENVIAGNSSYNIYFFEASGNRPSNNVIQNNYIGTNTADAVFSNGDGLYLNNADFNLIGGDLTTLERNIISNNTGNGGIYCLGNSNTICGNYIGTNALGTASLQNSHGILLGGYGNLVGGSVGANYGNIISGNQNQGIMMSSGGGNTVVGNFLGVNTNGDAALPNGGNGIYLGSGAQPCLIGKNDPDYRNVIAGNSVFGIYMASATGHQVVGNYIGINANGDDQLLNGSDGILLTSSVQNLIVNNFSAQTFTLSTAGTFGNTLAANKIGMRPNLSPVTGLGVGIDITTGAHGNFIGYPQGGGGNLIANATTGIAVTGGVTIENGIYGNTITAFSSIGIDLVSSGNTNYAIPAIVMADSVNGVSGTAQANDYIEVFVAENNPGGYGGSLRLVGYTNANGVGNWSLAAGGLFVAGEYICATATDTNHNTSAFSLNHEATGPIPTVTPTLTPLPATATFTSTPTMTVTPTSPLADVNLNGKFALAYPNPAKDEVHFVMHLDANAKIGINIFNLNGEQVASLETALATGKGHVVIWNCQDFAAGIYFVQIIKGNKLIETHKVAIIK